MNGSAWLAQLREILGYLEKGKIAFQEEVEVERGIGIKMKNVFIKPQKWKFYFTTFWIYVCVENLQNQSNISLNVVSITKFSFSFIIVFIF